MGLNLFFFFIQSIIYFNGYDYVLGNPMFGPNVRDANENEFPYIVALVRVRDSQDPSDNHVCTGSLITRQDVLTAAHCFEDESLEFIQVIVGTNNLNSGTRYCGYWWITYNDWAKYVGKKLFFRVNDVGTMRLLRPVPNNIDLGVLSSIPTRELYSKDVVIAAWGRNENNVVPIKLRTVELNVLKMNVCLRTLKELSGTKITVHNRHICTNANPYAVMHWGDSGGPILYMGMIVAVHKSTIPFPGELLNPRKLNIHTTITYYRDFIMYVIDSDFYWGNLDSSDE